MPVEHHFLLPKRRLQNEGSEGVGEERRVENPGNYCSLGKQGQHQQQRLMLTACTLRRVWWSCLLTLWSASPNPGRLRSKYDRFSLEGYSTKHLTSIPQKRQHWWNNEHLKNCYNQAEPTETRQIHATWISMFLEGDPAWKEIIK